MRSLVTTALALALTVGTGSHEAAAAKPAPKQQPPAQIVFRFDISAFPDHAQYAFSGPISLTRIADAAWSSAPPAEPPIGAGPEQNWWTSVTPEPSRSPPRRRAVRPPAKSSRTP